MLRKSNKSAGWNWLPLGVMVELLVLTAPESGVICAMDYVNMVPALSREISMSHGRVGVSHNQPTYATME